MKTPSCFALSLTGALCLCALTPACSTPSPKAAARHPVRAVERLGQATIMVGAPAREVLRSLGKPYRKLSDDVWLYRNFNAGSAQSPDDDCGTLMLMFTEGAVSDIQLINDHAEVVFAARLAPRSDAVQVAAVSKDPLPSDPPQTFSRKLAGAP